MDELKWGAGALSWNSDYLAFMLDLDADVALLIVMGVALKERLHGREDGSRCSSSSDGEYCS